MIHIKKHTVNSPNSMERYSRKGVEVLMKEKTQNTILIVEDDPFIAIDLEEIFRSAGYVVMGPVAVLAIGLAALDDQLPDVAALDYELGSENSTAIAQVLDDKNIPYIVVTGKVDKVVADGEINAANFFSKPYNPEKIVEAINALV